jgi:hypothetical protein
MDKKISVGIYIVALSTLISHVVALVIFFNPVMSASYPRILVYGLFSLFPFINICLNYNWYVVGIIYSLIFIILSIFIFRLENMARIIFIAFQIVFLLIGIAGTIFTLLWVGEMQHQRMSTSTFIVTQFLPSIWMGCLFPLLFLIYLTRLKVKEQFK